MIVVVAATTSTLVLTAGRTQALEAAVISQVDEASSRAVVLSLGDDAGVKLDVSNTLGAVRGVSWVGAFGAAVDAENGLVPGGRRVTVRTLSSHAAGEDLLPRDQNPSSTVALASEEALKTLGFDTASGFIVTSTGEEVSIGGKITPPSYLADLEPLILVRGLQADTELASIIIVVATRAADVPALAATLPLLVGANDARAVTVKSSAAVELLRTGVQSELATSTSVSVSLALLGGGLLVTLLVMSNVVLRRRDYGRRRALGASRGFVVGLICLECLCAAVPGALIGTTGSYLLLSWNGVPVPDSKFAFATIILGLIISVLSTIPPALVAANRDPIAELRVP
ncbi:hypothetical protein GSU10_01755 [Rathayibacter tanaceti]|nr:hypothetical protein GSU10_01755 [Rathayibacter tanaceti]